MNHQYLSVLQEVLRYEQNSLRVISIFFAVTIVVLLAVIVIRYPKEKVSNRIIMLGFGVLLCLSFGIYGIVNHQYMKAIKTDIEHCSFVTYSGSFVHDDYQRDSFYHNLEINPDGENSLILRYPDYGNQYGLHGDRPISVGTWSGTVFYGEHSKIVVHCILEEIQK